MKKILVIQQKMIGDVLLSTLICENIKLNYPEYQVHYLVNHNTLPVLENNPYIDKLIILGAKQDESYFELIKFAKELNQEKYDVVIDAYSKIQSWTTVFYNKAPQKISYFKKGRAFLYTDTIKKHKVAKTNLGLAIEHRLALLAPLNIKVVKQCPELYVTPQEIEETKLLFKTHHIDNNKPNIMISLLGSDAIKTYPLNYMAQIVDFIGQNYDVNILFNYFPKQYNEANYVLSQCSSVTKSKIAFNLYGGNLRSFIAIMSQCDIIIGNDGGAINMAKALNKKSFIIFSPWIEKRDWATFEDGINHVSVHLNDYMPELFKKKKTKALKALTYKYYNFFEPNLFSNKLQNFLNTQLNYKYEK
jgi:ADP-heptose:LPS heptosyltransferase